jgi:hypothetical protein
MYARLYVRFPVEHADLLQLNDADSWLEYSEEQRVKVFYHATKETVTLKVRLRGNNLEVAQAISASLASSCAVHCSSARACCRSVRRTV